MSNKDDDSYLDPAVDSENDDSRMSGNNYFLGEFQEN
jgi:hypothetical protein